VHPASEWKSGDYYKCPCCSFIVSAEERETKYIETECPRCCECYPDWIKIEDEENKK